MALQDVVQRFPDTDYARDATLKIDLTLDHLAGKEMSIGRYYLRQGNYIGAINRFRTVVEEFQRTSQIAEALERLTEAYYALGVYNEAKTAAAVLGANYPGSVWYQGLLHFAHGAQYAAADGKRLLDQQGVRFPVKAAMLTALTVRDIVLIEASALDFAPGLNVLTGETGAGKSILLDALGLAAGGRAGARAGVRPGAAQGSAIAIFDPEKKHPARALLRESAMEAAGEIILRRVISADGRTRAFVNDEPVGVALLRDLGALLVEVHGQADDRGLFDNATHRRLLDAFGHHETLSEGLAVLYAKLESTRAHARAFRSAAVVAAADADYISHAADELSALGPQEGEEAALASPARY